MYDILDATRLNMFYLKMTFLVKSTGIHNPMVHLQLNSKSYEEYYLRLILSRLAGAV
jgi:hypothetical protein